jgi:predicted permease
MMEIFGSALQDIAFAIRSFRKNSGFTLAALLTLALGIGANTTIYSVIDGVLLHPIPFPEPDRLVVLYQSSQGNDKNAVSYPNLLDWQRSSQTFEAIAGWRTDIFTMTQSEEPEQLVGTMVSANFFSVVRTEPLLGRTFTKDEDQRQAAPVVLLGEDFWRRRFAADSTLVGKSIRLNNRDYGVIGIVPAAVRLERGPGTFFNDVFVPIGQYEDPLFDNRGVGNGTLGLGRLKAGVTRAQAQSEMDGIMRTLGAEYPTDDAGTGVNLVDFRQDRAGGLRTTLIALGGAVGFVLLIACANVAGLSLARSTGRLPEFGVRLALGAGRRRLVRQLLTESILLSLMGGAVGALIASWGTQAALSILPSALPAISRVEVNTRALLFTAGASILAGVLFGLAPAVKATKLDLYEAVKQAGRGVTWNRHRVQQVFIVSEIALTLILLAGTGLMLRSLQKVWSIDPGFNANGLVTFYTGISPERGRTPQQIRSATREIGERLKGIPGVESASVEVGGLPLRGSTTVGFLTEADPANAAVRETRVAQFYAVAPDHFKTMGITLLSGRSFSTRDTIDAPLVAIVDEELVRRDFNGENPIGRHIRTNLFDRRPAEIVGVVGHVKHSGLDLDSTAKDRAQLYVPLIQLPDVILPLAASAIAGIVRSTVPLNTLMSSIRLELGSFNRDRAVHSEQLMTDSIAVLLAGRRFSLVVLAVFAATALVLSVVGVYGVVAYFVGQRTNEIGLRMALGAAPRAIFLEVVSEGGKLACIGLLFGLAGAAALTQAMRSLLFEISPTDPLTFIAVAAILAAAALGALIIPARRAALVEPMVALRNE